MTTKEDGNSVKRVFVGGLSGLSSALLLQPLDVVKTRLQRELFLYDKASSKPNFFSTTKSIWRNEGISGFWRASIPTAFRASLGPAAYFVFLEQLNAFDIHEVDSRKIFVGAAARTFAAALINPITVMKTRMEWSSDKNQRMFVMLRDFFKTEGFMGMFSGLGATLMRDVPQASLYLFFFSHLKKTLFEEFSISKANGTMVASFTAGVISTTLTLPFDVLKTRIQAQKSNNETWRDVITHVVRNQGIKGMFTGLSTRLMRKPLQLMISWSLYESFR